MPTPPTPLPSKEQIYQACYESIASAKAAGVNRVILGLSVDALRVMLDNQPMHAPVIVVWIDLVMDDDTEVRVSFPVFCDPGLSGYSVYAIRWPEVKAASPNVNIEIEEK